MASIWNPGHLQQQLERKKRQLRNSARGQLYQQTQRMQEPGYGRDAFMDVVQEAAPSLDTFLSAQAASGGSSTMAREQAQAAQARAARRGAQAFGQHQLGMQQQAMGGLRALMQNNQKRRLARKRREAQKGGLGQVLGTIGGSLIGGFTGGFGTQAATAASDAIF